MGILLRDVRYAFRALIKRPGFTIAAVLSLGLGIGANSTVFTLVNAAFLHALPMEEPDRVLVIYGTEERQPGLLPVSYPNYLDLRKRNEVLSGLAAFQVLRLNLFHGDRPERLIGQVVSDNYFEVFGVKPLAGRLLGPEDFTSRGGHPVTVLTYRYWNLRFGGDRSIVGQKVLLNGREYTVVGITPQHFKGANTIALNGPDVYIPMSMFETVSPLAAHFEDRSFRIFDMVGRLRPGVSQEQGLAGLRMVARQLEQAYPDVNRGQGLDVRPLAQALIFPQHRQMYLRAGWLLTAMAGLLLFIACANVASLLLTRGIERQREIAIRLSLGAQRSRMARQLLTESVVLALLGGILGMLIAVWGPDLLWKFRPPIVSATALEFGLEGRVLLFTCAIALATGILFGLAPALQTLRADLVPALKDEVGAVRRQGRRIPVRNLLIVTQVALSLLSLIGAGLFLRSLRNAQRIDPGFETRHLVNMRINLAAQGYSEERGRDFYRRVLSRLEGVPGVRSATLSMNLPLNRGAILRRALAVGGEAVDTEDLPYTRTNTVGPKYFETLGIKIVQGRGFGDQDRQDGPLVTVVNQTMAEQLWPGRSAVGQRLRTPEEDQELEVIGVAANSKYVTLGEPPEPVFYLFINQTYVPEVLIHVRTQGDPRALQQLVRQEVQAQDRLLPLADLEVMGDVIDASLWAPRMGAALLSMFGLLALGLAATGIYGVMAYSVNQRKREVGIRMALGAQRGDVLSLILRQALFVIGTGLAAGLAVAVAGSRLLASMLYGVSSTDVQTFATITAFLAAVALLASYLAARRSTRVDPVTALRGE